MFGYLDRDLIRTFTVTFLIVFAFTQMGLLVWTILDQYRAAFASDDSKMGWVLLYFLFSSPRNTAYIIPIGTAVSILWTYTVKARQNELLACFVGGISPFRLARPLLVLSFVLSAVAFATTEFLATTGDAKAESIEKLHIQGRKLESVTKERNVFQKGQGPRFYNVLAFNPAEAKLEFPIVFQMQENWSGPAWRLEAKSAQKLRVDGEDHWVFFDSILRKFDEKGLVTEFQEKPRILDTELNPPLERDLDRYIQQRFRPEQMPTAELIEYIDLMKRQKRPYEKLATHLHFNFSIPLGTLVLAVLMCGHILRPRATGAVVGFGGGLLLLAIYYVTTIFARQFSMEGVVHPAMAAYCPIAFFLLVGGLMLVRNRAL